MLSDEQRGCLGLAAYGVLAIAWMVWGGPGPGPPPFAGPRWWLWPVEAGIITLTWFGWTLMIAGVIQALWLLAQALYVAVAILLIRIQTALRASRRQPRP